MLTITETLLVCDICHLALCNDDFTPIDYYYDNEEAEEILALVQAGMQRIKASELIFHEEIGFSTVRCRCCGSTLAGDRFEYNRIGSFFGDI